ncbi:MAG: hypothetical protein MI807_21730 [Verrucomicrobiales bacterium]|nr:hypothetical protein [Verrucomicrobiales bacterium]
MKLKVKIGIPVVGALLAALSFFVFSRNSDPSSTVQKLNSAAGNFDFVVEADQDLRSESQIGTSPESVIQHAEEGLVLSTCDENGISVALFKSEENAQEIVRLQDSNLGVPISDSFMSGRFERKYPGGVTEWYDNAEVGIQHGFTLHSSDTIPRKDGFPHIEISLDTEFSVSLDRNDRVGDHIVFESDSTSQRLFYHSLVVVDATGKKLPSLLRLGRSNTEARTIEIAFCDADAVYPVTVDPFFSTTLSSPFVGDESSAPSHFTTEGETLFFTAEDSNSGRELWKIESPSEDPILVSDINPGLSSSNPDQIAVINNLIVFTADDGTHGEELWVSNGTSEGTLLLADIANGIETSNPRIEATTGSLLFFVAENSTYGEELWVTDGTPANTRLVKDIYPGANSSQPGNIVEWNDEIYFGAWSPDSGRELWKSDGTELGTVLVKEINPGGSSSPSQITPTPGTLYFVGNDGAHGSELWKSDGTTEGTVLVEDIRAGAFDPSISIHGYTGGKLFFTADKDQGFQLWTSRGTAATTSPIEDPDLNASFILYPTSHWGQLYFAARSVGAGFSTFRMWRSSGTAATTQELANSPILTTGPFLSAGDQLFFDGHTEDIGSEIWVASRFSSSVTLTKDIFAGTEGSRRFVEDWPENAQYHFEKIANQVVFAARSSTGNFEPWISDGTESGTIALAEIAPGARGSFPGDFHEFEGSLFFSAETDHSGAELWSVDLSGLSSPKLFDLNSFSSTESLSVGDKTYFVANSEFFSRITQQNYKKPSNDRIFP